MIDLDRVLFQMSDDNDVYGGHYSTNDAKDMIDVIAKRYESKDGDYNYFLDMVKKYVGGRYPFDFFRSSPDQNLAKDIESMKRKK